MSRFISYYKPHKKLFFYDLLCAFLISGVDLVFPSVTRVVLGKYIPDGNMNMVIIFAVVLVGLYMLRAVMDYFINYWGHVIGIRMEAHMRSDLFRHLQTMPFKFYDKHRTGSLMSRMINDLNQMTELAHHGPEDIFISIVMIIGSFAVLINIEWRLTFIIFFVFFPILFWFTITRRSKISEGFRQVKEKIAEVNSQLENSLSGIRVSQSFTNEEFEVEKFNSGNDRFKKAKKTAYHHMSVFMTGINFMVGVLNVAVLCFGALFILRGYINYADLTAFLLYINLVLQPIRRLTNFTQQFEQGMTGFERFTEIMNVQPDIVDKIDAVSLDNIKGDIHLENITFAYNDHEKVLQDLDMKISAGTTVALVGPSGGGKTTLCHLIPRFYDLEKGRITIDGIDICDIKLESLRNNIGLVQQDVFLFTGTIKDNILYGRPDADMEDVIWAAEKANISEFIESLPEKYDTYIGEKGVRLSGGQKQRVSIARVFLKNPPILILDEATSSLDNETEIKIQGALEELSKGRTTLVIAHRLSTIRNADQIVVLTDSGIAERGCHQDLLDSDGIYAGLYKAQFRGFMLDEINE